MELSLLAIKKPKHIGIRTQANDYQNIYNVKLKHSVQSLNLYQILYYDSTHFQKYMLM